ncbi:MAG: ATP-dependent DNA helicase, partial [Xanthomonadales bacterium]|nr:ATP-dependent DNA helicase [Xanthomonadales bacterium]
RPVPAALDVLAQQIVAEVAAQDWHETALYDCLVRAWPYAELSRERFEAVLRMLADGYSRRRGPAAVLLHRDGVHGQLRARRGARLTAISSGGAIPDNADYQVWLEPEALMVGSVHEDFAVESMAGDIFQLGNTSYRILRVEQGKVRVEDAAGLPPSVPFWLGEAPGRSDVLSAAVSRLRQQAAAQLVTGGEPALREWLRGSMALSAVAVEQLADYLARSWQALGLLPTQDQLVLERFFDESGGMQLVIHSPLGSRLNRAWGLALRKRFCRRFNFELQAAATEDAIVLSLSTSHSFPLDEVGHYLHSASVGQVLTQALLDAPMFNVRWRWNATTALALPRMQGGRKVAPQLQRMRAEDLVAQVFPDQIACAENLAGEREVPDHPLVQQTLADCLDEAMDLAGLQALLRALEAGQAQLHARDLTAPSPLAAEILSARPYAFLDDAPLEERRTQAVQARRWQSEDLNEGLARLDPAAVAAVTAEAWPLVRDADEMHALLLQVGWLTPQETARHAGGAAWLQQLSDSARATQLRPFDAGPEDGGWWVAAERLLQLR